jgi:type IV secretion system protein VirD4
MSATKILWGQIITVFFIVLLTMWAATEWTAWRLGFQPELGQPWFEVLRVPFYLPPIFFWWWFAYNAYAPSIFIEGAYIAASGGIIAAAVAIGMSVWRAREVKNAETYGSARWARPAEMKAAGLLGPDGVVLGRHEKTYLRHDGPEHVLCFAPTRRACRADAADLAGLRDRSRHQGGELVDNSRVSRAIRACAAVRPDQWRVRRLQSAPGGQKGRMGSS